MATYSTALAKEQIEIMGGGSLAHRTAIQAINSGAAVLVATGSFTTPSATMTAGDVINICVIPKGARIIPELSYVSCEALGTACSTKIGTKADDGYYLTATDLKTAGTYQLKGGVGCIADEVTSSPTTILATLTGTPATTAGKKIKFTIAYAIQ